MAARKFGVPIDLTKNEIQNAVLQVLGTAPGTPAAGQMYFDSAIGVGNPRWRNAANSGWINPFARADHTGTQLAVTISDFDTQVRTSRLDQMAAPTASVSLNSQKITNLQDGTAAQDAVTFVQLQAVLNGRDFKDSVRAATTAAGTLASSFANGSTIDGVTLATSNRILIKNQASGSENGIYTVNASGAPTRATDADTSAEVTANMSVMVEEGTTLADTQWTLTTNNPITLGTTALVFAQTGAGTTYTQGTGISISGGVISVDTAVVARKFTQLIGDGTSTSLAVTHSLSNQWVVAQVIEVATGAQVEVDVVYTSATVTTFIFAVAPASNAYRVMIVG